MKGVIKADISRMVRNKLTWIFIVISVAGVLMTTGMYALMTLLAENIPADEGGAMMGAFAINSYETLFAGTYNSDVLILIVTVMAVLFASAPYRSGFIKTISEYVKPRYKLIVSEYVCIFIYSVIIAFVAGIAAFLFGGLMFKGLFASVTTKLLLKLLGFVAGHSLLLGTFACMIVGMTNVLKNTALTLISSLLYASGFGTIIHQLISLALFRLNLCSEGFALADYTVIGNIYGMTVDSMGDDIIRVAIVCVIVALLSMSVSSLMIEKQDIK